MGSTECSVGIGKTLPIGEASSTSDPQGVESSAADSNSIGSLGRIETQRPGYSGSYCIGTLGSVIESPFAHRRNVRKSTLNLVGHCQSREKLFSILPGIFTRSKDRTQVVTGVTA